MHSAGVAPAVTEDHLQVHRPRGSYQSLDQGERFQVKRIVVKQGGRSRGYWGAAAAPDKAPAGRAIIIAQTAQSTLG